MIYKALLLLNLFFTGRDSLENEHVGESTEQSLKEACHMPENEGCLNVTIGLQQILFLIA